MIFMIVDHLKKITVQQIYVWMQAMKTTLNCMNNGTVYSERFAATPFGGIECSGRFSCVHICFRISPPKFNMCTLQQFGMQCGRIECHQFCSLLTMVCKQCQNCVFVDYKQVQNEVANLRMVQPISMWDHHTGLEWGHLDWLEVAQIRMKQPRSEWGYPD